jgi:ethanolamine utilization protein EutN
MQIARVIGNVVATVRHPIYSGHKLLLVQPLALDGSDRGRSYIALDFAHAGKGDRVLVVNEGQSGRQMVADASAPVRSVIVGVVDEIAVEERRRGSHPAHRGR